MLMQCDLRNAIRLLCWPTNCRVNRFTASGNPSKVVDIAYGLTQSKPTTDSLQLPRMGGSHLFFYWPYSLQKEHRR